MLGRAVGLARIAVAEVLRNFAVSMRSSKCHLQMTSVFDAPREDSAPDLLFEWTRLIPA